MVTRPGGAAVLVQHHGQVGLEPLHVGQHVLDLAGPGHEQRRPHYGADRDCPGLERRAVRMSLACTTPTISSSDSVYTG